jgi:hypothetical protein
MSYFVVAVFKNTKRTCLKKIFIIQYNDYVFYEFHLAINRKIRNV